MASRRILTYISIFIVGALVVISCGTTEKAQRDAADDSTRDNAATDETAVSEEFLTVLNSNRSKLSDAYLTLSSDIPEIFTQESTARDIGDPNRGYRIQILSTRDLSQADSIANDFRFWAQDRFAGYVPKAYVLRPPRQPYFKVHIGNFHFHDHATKLNQLIKDRYPDAWVVPDEVEPNLVPADTSFTRRE